MVTMLEWNYFITNHTEYNIYFLTKKPSHSNCSQSVKRTVTTHSANKNNTDKQIILLFNFAG